MRIGQLAWIAALCGIATGCASFNGPSVDFAAPRVTGRVVDDASGRPVKWARVGRKIWTWRKGTGEFLRGGGIGAVCGEGFARGMQAGLFAAQTMGAVGGDQILRAGRERGGPARDGGRLGLVIFAGESFAHGARWWLGNLWRVMVIGGTGPKAGQARRKPISCGRQRGTFAEGTQSHQSWRADSTDRPVKNGKHGRDAKHVAYAT